VLLSTIIPPGEMLRTRVLISLFEPSKQSDASKNMLSRDFTRFESVFPEGERSPDMSIADRFTRQWFEKRKRSHSISA
jgi:hypothetical protein